LPASFEALADRAIECDAAARALAAALAALSASEREALLAVLAGAQGRDFGRVLARLVGAAGSPGEARMLASVPVTPGRAFRGGDSVFLVAHDEPGALEVTRGRVAVHDRLDLDGLESAPLDRAIDEAAQLLWRHHRGALPQGAERFADLFDPAVPRSRWRS